MSSNNEHECKKICLERILYAVLYAVAMQYILLTLFLLLVNFSIFHPISWITGSLSLIFSFYTWIRSMPLISSVVVHGVILAKTYIAQTTYYKNRFSMILHTFLRKTIFMIVHCLVGFLTAWLYTNFLSSEYSSLLTQSKSEKYFLNTKFLFLVLSGIYAGMLFFVRERLKTNVVVTFPVIQQQKFLQLKAQFWSILYKSLAKSIIPTFFYIGIYYSLATPIKNFLIKILNAQIDEENDTIYNFLKDFKLIFFVWILTSQIISNMHLMQILFNIFLTEYKRFPIEKSDPNEISLIEAISVTKVPITQQLASLDLLELSNSFDSSRRRTIFALSIPGGHPYNWKSLSGQCLTIIKNYSTELTKSIEKIKFVQNNNTTSRLKSSASDMAEKLLIRQYNESFGVRNMSQFIQETNQYQQQSDGSLNKADEIYNRFHQKINKVKESFMTLPGINYLFKEQENAKISYVLSQSQEIIWITQGISALAAHSIAEDNFGVVQNDLPEIIKSLLDLKLILDKVTALDLGGKKVDRNYISLKNAVKRSLFRICTVFSVYMKDLITDANDLRLLQSFLNFREII